MPKKFKTIVEYDGSNYHGWQFQPDQPTVQGELERALEKIFHIRIPVYGAGRTDAGVHASGQVAHLIASWKHPVGNFQKALNSILPEDICIKDLSEADADFHARHSAISKIYQYQILNQESRAPLKQRFSWRVSRSLSVSKLDEASHYLIGAHDFVSFGSPTSGTTSTVREIYQAGWEKGHEDHMLVFTICGSGFLRYMVRSLVGTLIQVGLGKITVRDFQGILASCDRSKSGLTAPPQGLCLVSVQY